MKRGGAGRTGWREGAGGAAPPGGTRATTPRRRRAPSPIAQLTIRTRGRDADGSDVESTTSSASEITYGTRTSAGGSHGGGRFGDESSNSGPHRVTRMPFTDAYGEKRWYTEETAGGSGLPHGQGLMHYCDGRMGGGWWSNGLAGGPPGGARGAGGGTAGGGAGGPNIRVDTGRR